ncbi:hypothetical protein FRC05_007988 [Tulasnella sp. 425]|nr:hypothetical protein FRC05_007988 [Tulasnella sp. 425]
MSSETVVIARPQSFELPNIGAPPPIPVPSTHADGLHQMHLLTVGGLYAAPDLVEKTLLDRQNSGSTPYVLDVGTGSGVWAREIAQKFPGAQVVGIDLVSVPLTAGTPSNCTFEVRDVTSEENLRTLEQKFDIVHIRALDNAVHDYKRVIDNVSEVLRPGGVLLLASVGMYAYDEGKKLLSSSTSDDGRAPSALGCLFNALREMFSKQGRATDTLWAWPNWLNGDAKYEQFGMLDGYNPLDGERPEKAIGALTKENTLGILSISETMLIQAGWEPDMVKEWVEGSRREIEAQEPHVYKLFRYAWAVRTTL